MNETKRGEAIARGIEAKALKENPTLDYAFNDILEGLFFKLLDSQLTDEAVLG